MPQIEIATMSAIQVNLKEIANQLALMNKLKTYELTYSRDHFGIFAPTVDEFLKEQDGSEG